MIPLGVEICKELKGRTVPSNLGQIIVLGNEGGKAK